MPFSIGLPLLVIGIMEKIEGVRLAGIILTGFAVVGFAAMSTLISSLGWVTGVVGPVIVLGLGVYLLVSALMKKKDEAGAPPAS